MGKICSKCNKEKENSEFYINKKKNKYFAHCKDCHRLKRNMYLKTLKIRNFPITKTCNTCNKEKSINEFNKNKQSIDGYFNKCKECYNERTKQIYKLKHDEKIKTRRDYWNRTREERLKQHKIYRDNNYELYKKIQHKSYHKNKERRKKDPKYRLAHSLRERCRGLLLGKYKPDSYTKSIGCSYEFLVNYIENKFKLGMTWDNYGCKIDNWCIDHIIPLSKFNLENKTEFLKAMHYSNLQPLWVLENLQKSDKIIDGVNNG